MDPLSDALSMLTVSHTLSSRFEAAGRWTLTYPGYRSHIKFGCVLEGRFHLQIDGSQPVLFDTGDFYLLTHGQPFRSTSVPPGPLHDGQSVHRQHRDADGVTRFDARSAGEGTPVALASGRFVFEGEASELLLRHLPPLIRLRADDPAAKPMAALLELMRWETGDARPGAAIARTNLASLVMVQALRVHLASAPQPEGWLGAMADARIGTALSQMHGDLAQRWTVERLASAAGMSRTAFAVRFKALTGSTPLDYLAGWRMRVARHALRHGDEAIARIAERVGYQSETAFSAAFKRDSGESPGRFRVQARTAEEAVAA